MKITTWDTAIFWAVLSISKASGYFEVVWEPSSSLQHLVLKAESHTEQWRCWEELTGCMHRFYLLWGYSWGRKCLVMRPFHFYSILISLKRRAWVTLGCLFRAEAEQVPSFLSTLSHSLPKADSGVSAWSLYFVFYSWCQLWNHIQGTPDKSKGDKIYPLVLFSSHSKIESREFSGTGRHSDERLHTCCLCDKVRGNHWSWDSTWTAGVRGLFVSHWKGVLPALELLVLMRYIIQEPKITFPSTIVHTYPSLHRHTQPILMPWVLQGAICLPTFTPECVDGWQQVAECLPWWLSSTDGRYLLPQSRNPNG